VVPIDLFLAFSAPGRWIQSSFGSRWQALGFLDRVNEKSLRVLTLTDLWELDESRRSDAIASRLERNFYSRCPPEKRPRYLKEQEAFTPTEEVTGEKLEPGLSKSETPQEDLENNSEARRKVYDESLVFALEKTFRYHFWLGGILQLIGGMAYVLGLACASRKLRIGLQMLCRLPPRWSPKLYSHSWSTRTTMHDFRSCTRTVPQSVVALVWRSACLPCKVRITHCGAVIILM